MQMFPILNELKINSPARTTSVVAASIGSACSAYLLVGLTGYLSFGNNVTGNIVGMCLSYPLFMFFFFSHFPSLFPITTPAFLSFFFFFRFALPKKSWPFLSTLD